MLTSHRKIKWIHYITIFILFLFLFNILCNTNKVFAADADTKLIVTVGYWGDEEYTKAEKSISELATEYGTSRQIYTWIDEYGNAGTSEVEGIYISSLMSDLKINMDSIYAYNFKVFDVKNGIEKMKQWTPSQLFDTKYSFYPSFQRCLLDDTWHLSNFYNMASTRSAASYLQSAWDEKQQVEPILALYKKNTIWTDETPASMLDYSDLSDTAMPQLLFAQASVNNSGRGYMEEQVKELHIWFSGFPTVTVDSADINGDIGSTSRIKIIVSTPDEFLSEQLMNKIASKIQWSSDNEKVVTIDENGNVTFVNDGTAHITANYNGESYTIFATSGKGLIGNVIGNEDGNLDNSSGDDVDSLEESESTNEPRDQESSTVSGGDNNSTSNTVSNGDNNSTSNTVSNGEEEDDSGGYEGSKEPKEQESDNLSTSEFNPSSDSYSDTVNNEDKLEVAVTKERKEDSTKNLNNENGITDVATKYEIKYIKEEEKIEITKPKVKKTDTVESTNNKVAEAKNEINKNNKNSITLTESNGNSTNIYELPDNVTALPNINSDSKLSKAIAVCTVVLMLIGVIGKSIYFRKQII